MTEEEVALNVGKDSTKKLEIEQFQIEEPQAEEHHLSISSLKKFAYYTTCFFFFFGLFCEVPALFFNNTEINKGFELLRPSESWLTTLRKILTMSFVISDFFSCTLAVRPAKKAREFLNLGKDARGKLVEQVKNNRSRELQSNSVSKPLLLFTQAILSTIIVIDFTAGAAASVVGVKDAMRHSLFRSILMGFLFLSALFYYLSLAFFDIMKGGCELILNFPSSEVVRLYRRDWLQGLHATIGTFFAAFYRGLTFCYVMLSVLKIIPHLDLSDNQINNFGKITFAAAFSAALIRYTKVVFGNPLSALEDTRERSNVKISWRQLFWILPRSSIYGISRAMITGYLFFYMTGLIALSMPIAMAVMIPTIIAEYRYVIRDHELRKLASENTHDNTPNIQETVRVTPAHVHLMSNMLLVFNILGQIGRTVRGISFFDRVFASHLGGRLTLFFIGLTLGVDVHGPQLLYFQKKLEGNAEALCKDVYSLKERCAAYLPKTLLNIFSSFFSTHNDNDQERDLLMHEDEAQALFSESTF